MKYIKKWNRKLTPFGKIFFTSIGLILAIILTIIIIPNKPANYKSDNKAYGIAKHTNSTKVKNAKNKKMVRAQKTSKTKKLTMDSEYGILIELDSNKIIAEKNSDEIIYPASLTKVMTLIVAVENIKNYNDTFTFTYEITDPLFVEGASVAGFLDEETVPMIDVLYGAILPSGADATTALAMYVSGSEEKFVELMNKKAKELGLEDTNFVNCSGLHDINHYSTPHELALIMKYAMQNETCKKILTAVEYTTSATPQHPEGILLHSNTFEKMYGTEAVGVTITAGKTGYTDESGNCLVTYAEADDGKKYILATTKASGTYKPIYDAIDVYAEYAGTGEKNIQAEIPTPY